MSSDHARFYELEPRTRRRLVLKSVFRVLGTTILLFMVYWVIPVPGESGSALIGLIAGMAIFISLLLWQTRSILIADYPTLRAAEAVAIAVPTLLVVFALTYLAVSHETPTSFSQPLDHLASLYFAATVLSTVGFGDIVARSDSARVLVTIQMILDLVLVVGVARLLFGIAQMGQARKESSSG